MSPLSPTVRAASCGEFRRVRALSYTFSTVGWRACAGLSPTRRLSRNGLRGGPSAIRRSVALEVA
jgi:hypothetical protein